MVGFSRPAGRPVVLRGARRSLANVGSTQGSHRVPVSNIAMFLCRGRVLCRMLVLAQIVMTRCLLMMVRSGVMMGGRLVMVRCGTKNWRSTHS